MWWIIGLVISGIFGISQKILESLQQKVAVERQRWENSYQQVQREVQRQQRLIQQELVRSEDSLNYRKLADLHTASKKIADTTYRLLQDSKKTLDAMGKAIVNTAKSRKVLEKKKRAAWPWEKGPLEQQIVSLHKLRDEILIPDKDKVKAQRNSLREEVRRLNMQTANLRDLKKKIGQKNTRLDVRMTGIVKWYNEGKGYGFITPNNGSSDVYVNQKQLRGISYLQAGDKVDFFIRPGNKPWAANVTKAALEDLMW